MLGSSAAEEGLTAGPLGPAEQEPVVASKNTWRSRTSFGILAINYGSCVVRKSEIFLRYGLYALPDAEIGMDFFFWVIANQDDVILVDTGYAPAVGLRRGRVNIGSPIDMLRALGIAPDAVSRIILTHLHYDHIGNLREFPAADIVVQRNELDFWTGPYADRLQFSCLMEKDEMGVLLRANEEGRVHCVDGDQEIAPGIRTVLLGGHTPGQQIVVVEDAGRSAVLASDSLHYYEQLERDLPFAIVCNVQGMYAAYDVLRQLADSPSTALVAGHDPLVESLFPRLSTVDFPNVYQIW